MRLAAKLAAALFIGIGLIVAAQAVLHARAISALQERERRDDIEILATALSAGAGAIWARSGEDAALQFLAEANRRRTYTEIQVQTLPERQAVDPPGVVRVSNLSEGDEATLVASATIYASDGPVGVLKLRRTRPYAAHYLSSAIRSQIVTTVAIALLCAVFALVLGYLLVGRPVDILRAQARSVAQGDFGHRNDLHQRDELGTLAHDLNQMSDRLLVARAQVKSERTARTNALEQLRHADRLATVGRLASSMAHELGTPLNVVGGRATLIQETKNLPDDAQEHAAIIKTEVDRMTLVIRDTLDFARPKALERRATTLRALLDEAASLMEPIADEREVSIEVLGPAECEADVDRRKMLQVITNLMTNAIDAMPSGGTIRMKAATSAFLEPASAEAEPGAYASFNVCDTGVGIDDEKLKTIFRPFYTTKREGRGTGLGLGVCQGIVREHGGWMEVTSKVGEGTCFTVFLPASEAS